IAAASRRHTPSLRSASRSSNRPASEDWLPPAKSTVSFLRRMAGRSKGSGVSVFMTAEARRRLDEGVRLHNDYPWESRLSRHWRHSKTHDWCIIRASSVIIRGSDLPFSSGSVIVLNPQLRVVPLHEFFDHLAALRCLLPVRVGDRNFFVRDLFRI